MKKNEILSFSSKWMELENILLSKVRLRRPKIPCSHLYVNYRPKTNAVILDMSRTLRENAHRRNRERERNLKLECA
jgi:hypothetical protein